MTTKFSLFTAGSTITPSADQVVGLQASANVRWTWAQVAAAIGVGKYTANIGDGTNVSYTVNHALGTRDVQCTVYRNATPYDEVIVDVQHTDANNVTFLFSTAPTTNQFRVVIWA
jgi:hypothetical protein